MLPNAKVSSKFHSQRNLLRRAKELNIANGLFEISRYFVKPWVIIRRRE